MDYCAKEEIRQLMQPRYRRAKKAIKQKILDEFCALSGYHRKYAIALLKKPVRIKKRVKQKSGRKPHYQDEVFLTALQRIWREVDLVCSTRLKAAIPLWLPHYATLALEIEQKLLSISTATIDRVLKPLRDSLEIKRRCQTRPGTLLKKQIPYKLDIPWSPSTPGFVEADTVAHCGGSVSGDFAWSLTMTDIRTTWTENRAVWNKGATGVLEQIRDIELNLPFVLLGFNSDNGSEFLNQYLIGYLQYVQKEKLPSFLFSRSRPGKKNDNAHVEQKNWTHVRHLFGYYRLGKFGVVDLMNDLYKNEWRLYQNFFMPAMKLIKKQRIGSHYRKEYDEAKTPYQRVLDEPLISQAEKDKLIALYKTLDPFALKKKIQLKLQRILNFVR
jgi:hypothetical protein